MLGNRQSQHSFATTPSVSQKRSSFDRSFAVKDTFDFDYLVPIFVDEILPGDTASVSVNTFARLATQKVPILDNMYVDYFFFFVPNRLIWDNFEKFMGAQDNPGDSTSYICPQMTMDGTGGTPQPDVGTIYDKMGLPVLIGANYTIKNTLPLRAYYKIWNDWFRDQNLQNSVVLPTDDGPDVRTDFVLLKRGKRHDYFTSAFTAPQKHSAVGLSITGTAPVEYVPHTESTVNSLIRNRLTGALYGVDTLGIDAAGKWTAITAAQGAVLDPQGRLRANLTAGTITSTINALRESIALQVLYERDQRGGTRYVELLRAHFGVISPDFRLQRAEFLGGGQSRINAHPVAQTSPTSGSNYQGALAAFGTSSSSGGIGFSKSFVEHGYVIGLACARGDISYQQCMNRMWKRSTRVDFYWPEFAQLGEQAITTGEIKTVGGTADDAIWGYQERYAEYRYKPSEIHGQFRSSYSAPLDFWHLAENFVGALAPALGASFIEQNTPIVRCLASSTAPHLLFDGWFKYTHVRPMPVYSIPATLGRF